MRGASVLSYVFPLRAADSRFGLNAHPDQHLAAVFDNVAGCSPTTVTAQCTGPSTVNLTCTGSAADPDWDCTPSGTFITAYGTATEAGTGSYTCLVTGTNTNGSDNPDHRFDHDERGPLDRGGQGRHGPRLHRQQHLRQRDRHGWRRDRQPDRDRRGQPGGDRRQGLRPDQTGFDFHSPVHGCDRQPGSLPAGAADRRTDHGLQVRHDPLRKHHSRRRPFGEQPGPQRLLQLLPVSDLQVG
ncbi:MAG: hypothetical protein MZV64_34655 [Ignavibacteriales bacterium]|nr:hypothetical protein [Ignavibacteriales bacterium]